MSERTLGSQQENGRESRDAIDKRQALKLLGAALFTGLFGKTAEATLFRFDSEEAEAMSADSEYIYGEMGKLFNFITEQHDSFRENLKGCFSSQELDTWVDYIEKQINLYVYVRVKNKNEERGSLQIIAEQEADIGNFVLQTLNRASNFPVQYLNDSSFIKAFNAAIHRLSQSAAVEFAK